MEVFSYLAAFLLINRLQKSLKFSPLKSKWNNLLRVGWWSVIVLYILAQAYLSNITGSLSGAAVLIGLIFYLEKEPDFKHFRSYVVAHYPLAALTLFAALVEKLAPKFYNEYDNYFSIAIVGAFIWIFAKWATAHKQQEEIRIFGEKNAELDRLVAERTAELTQQKNELEQTLALLQTTQKQLIQSEKLASLGELTAGIAHEIQNPLNFVNNFSEVSVELLEEMQLELNNGDKDEAIAIAEDIKQNLEKIRHHGKRADGIVKGMLQHSRTGSGVKEPTDINALADEYLRLSYHGLRAKDKSFNSELVMHFAENLPHIDTLQQDLGRVLLNLYNNAFYAVHQKQKGNPAFKPVVEVSTIKRPGSIEIRVKDNGTGIPADIKEKIMQPFFTTKPTGEGTGLGLSLSYDIVVKAHGGTIAIDSKEGEFTTFIITLPL